MTERTRPCLRHRLAIAVLGLATVGLPIGHAQQAPNALPFGPPAARPRVVVTTDGEIDDRDSMIRFLLYANEFEIEALIYNSSRFHWLGNAWAGTEWISDEIDMYSRVYPFLRQNADGYPTPEFLQRLQGLFGRSQP